MLEQNFELHPQLVKDCVEVGDFTLCKVLLINDSHFPWLILVPRRAAVTEMFHLNSADQHQLLAECNAVALVLDELFSPDKLNIAALGNVVPQLHIHCIARFKTDLAWPKPVWGVVSAEPYSDNVLVERLQVLRARLAALLLV